MGQNNSKYEMVPENIRPINSFDSILTSDKAKLWNEGFRCECGFYLEPGCLKEGEIEISDIIEDRYKHGHLRHVKFRTDISKYQSYSRHEYTLADLEDAEQNYFNQLGYKEIRGVRYNHVRMLRVSKKTEHHYTYLILPEFRKCKLIFCHYSVILVRSDALISRV